MLAFLKELREIIDLDKMQSAECMQNAIEEGQELLDLKIEQLSLLNQNERSYHKEIEEENEESTHVIMTVNEFKDGVKVGAYGFDDGDGFWVKDNLACDDDVFETEPGDATHVLWYNK